MPNFSKYSIDDISTSTRRRKTAFYTYEEIDPVKNLIRRYFKKNYSTVILNTSPGNYTYLEVDINCFFKAYSENIINSKYISEILHGFNSTKKSITKVEAVRFFITRKLKGQLGDSITTSEIEEFKNEILQKQLQSLSAMRPLKKIPGGILDLILLALKEIIGVPNDISVHGVNFNITKTLFMIDIQMGMKSYETNGGKYESATIELSLGNDKHGELKIKRIGTHFTPHPSAEIRKKIKTSSFEFSNLIPAIIKLYESQNNVLVTKVSFNQTFNIEHSAIYMVRFDRSNYEFRWGS